MIACARYLLAGALALIALGSAAQADHPMLLGGTNLVGGPGGGPFHLSCPPDSFLVGALSRSDGSGEPLNYYEPLCAYVEANGTTGPLFKPLADNAGAGSISGGLAHAACPPGYVVSGFGAAPHHYSDQSGVYVGAVSHICIGVSPPFLYADDRGNIAGSGDTAFSDVSDVRCPFGQWAIGVYGGSGLHIDSFGLVCGRALGPYAAATEPTPAPAPAPVIVAPVWDEKTQGVRSPYLEAFSGAPPTSAYTDSAVLTPAPAYEDSAHPVVLGTVIEGGAAARPAAPEAPPALLDSQTYQPPLAKGGLRLYACQSLDNEVCERPVADIFCKQQGFVQTASYDTGKAKGPAAAINGQKCTQKTCRVFDEIVCVR
jgi:hypothetical protein